MRRASRQTFCSASHGATLRCLTPLRRPLHRLAFGDHLTADFNAQSYSGRLEGGYRFGTPYGITPYAAIQAQSFHTLGYTEAGVIPNSLALAFGSRDATDTRSELGARFDRVLAVYQHAVLALRGRVAWPTTG